MILLKNCRVYAPQPLGKLNLLLSGSKVAAMDKVLEPALPGLEKVDCDGLLAVPGLIDGHVHIAGAGGEGGPATRTPEMPLSMMLAGGITTVVGCLGTDGYTRSVESVLMKCKSLRAEGVSCWIYTGAYQVPAPTILGDPGRDIALIEEVIGVGEVAVSDHRSSCPTPAELARLAAQARVGGMLGGKAGIVNLHMGDAPDPFGIVRQAVGTSQLTFKQFLPTHCNRNPQIFEDAKEYGQQGYVDITTSAYPFFPEEEKKPSRAVAELASAGVPLEHITMSSDGCGSLPQFDPAGNLVRLVSGEPRTLYNEMVDLWLREKLPLEQALLPATANPASILKLPGKGFIRRGADADLLIMDEQGRMVHLIANGAFMVRDGTMLKKGTFEN
jgi:beta-aspartyl-dipeptidase (metallo-type)